MERKADACVILLVGLPGCGKTTFAKRLLTFLPTFFPEKNVAYLELDELERKQKVEHKIPLEKYDATIWKMTRERAIKETEETLIKKDQYIIIVDDNFYYESMRKPYVHLCQKFNAGLLHVVFQLSEKQAKLQNSLREGDKRVAEEIIERMEGKIEFPEPESGYNVLSIKEWNLKDDAELWKEIKEKVEYALLNPMKDIVKEMEEKREQNREATRKSLIHQIDIAVRQEIGAIIKQMSKQTAKLKGKLVSKQKEIFMEKLNKAAKGVRDEGSKEIYDALNAGDGTEIQCVTKLFNSEIKKMLG